MRAHAHAHAAGSKAALVALVTPDVSQAGRALLGEVFTEVVEVPYIEAKYVTSPSALVCACVCACVRACVRDVRNEMALTFSRVRKKKWGSGGSSEFQALFVSTSSFSRILNCRNMTHPFVLLFSSPPAAATRARPCVCVAPFAPCLASLASRCLAARASGLCTRRGPSATRSGRGGSTRPSPSSPRCGSASTSSSASSTQT